MNIKIIAAAGAVLAAFALGGAAHAQVSPYNFTYYGGYNETGPGFDFTGATVIGSDTGVVGVAEDRDIGGSDTAPNWPDASNIFMADVTATLNVATAGAYTFTLGSDDGGYLYVDGNLLLNDGGIHALETISGSEALSAGPHSIEIQYGNALCCGAVLDFSVAGAPEPVTWGLMVVGFGGLGAVLRRRRTTSFAAV